MGEGKYVVQKAGLWLSVVAFAFFFTAFVSPYWVQSWPRVYSPFKRIGLWEACFAGLVVPTESGVPHAYHGCWWILAKYYTPIRSWLMPPWFVICQFVEVVIALLFLIQLILLLWVWCRTDMGEAGTGKRRKPIVALQTATVITVVMAVMQVLVVLLFGLYYYYDRNWMPHPVLNYLSWSYGCAVVAAFFLIFSSIAQIMFTKYERQELREPPTHPNISMTHLDPPTKEGPPPERSYSQASYGPGYGPAGGYGPEKGYGPGSRSQAGSQSHLGSRDNLSQGYGPVYAASQGGQGYQGYGGYGSRTQSQSSGAYLPPDQKA